MNMQIKYKKLHPKAVAPFKATDGAAGFDLTAVTRQGNVFGTGLAFDIPAGYVLLIYSRSGHGFKESTRLSNCVGVIDSDYTGEIKVALRRDDGKPLTVQVGDRVAQGVLMRLPKVTFTETQELKETERNDNGFGSTGK
jgi:dUTP pyrophosphatase